MKILIIGSGGREHSIGIALKQSATKSTLFFAPGNAGTQELGTNLSIKDTSISELKAFAVESSIDMTIVGPEAPLVAGIVDDFTAAGLSIIGPSAEGAQLEGSKEWAKNFMHRCNIPTASFESFVEFADAKDYILSKNTYPIVIKADGLAAGKGVTVAATESEAMTAIEDCFLNEKFKEAGLKVVIEDFLVGQEASIFAFTDGKTILPMVPAQDHKAVYDGDMGPNTGGMGAYSPAPLVTPEIEKVVYERVFKPILEGFQRENISYKGIVYAGLMISPDNDVSIVEFNVRFGDPETQIVLPRLKTDLLSIFQAISEERLSDITLEWDDRYAVCVVLASEGYPEDYEKGLPIKGINLVTGEDTHVVHAGTQFDASNTLVTSGGRVLAVVGQGDDLKTAVDTAYKSVKLIQFANKYYRTDIAFKAFSLV